MMKSWFSIYFLGLVVISHLLLPLLNRSEDWLVFSSWKMFSGSPTQSVTDITWDQGKTFLLRDHRAQTKTSGLMMTSLISALSTSQIKLLKENFKPKLLNFCQCEQIELVKLKGTLYQQIVLKENLEIIQRQTL